MSSPGAIDDAREASLSEPRETALLGDLVQRLPLPPSAWQDLDLAAGEALFRSGDPGDTFYVVTSGEIEVFVEDRGSAHITLARLGPGDYLGELALLDGGPRTASAAATSPSHLRALSRETFTKQLAHSPALAGALVSPLSERLRNVLGYLEHLIGWARQAAEGSYADAQAAIDQQVQSSSGDAARFYQSFADMLAAVAQREADLRREVAELRILIDPAKHRAELEEIVDSDFFRQLEKDARRVRARHHDAGQATDP